MHEAAGQRVNRRRRRPRICCATLAPQVLGALVRRYGHFDAVRGRGAGGAARRRACSGPARGRPGQPAAWLSTVAARRLIDELRGARRPAPARGRPSAPRPSASPTPPDAAGRRRHAHAAVPVLPSRAVAAVAARAHAARGRRSDHRGDRARVPRPRGDDGPAHQPGQAAHQGCAAPFQLPPERRARRAARRRAARAVPRSSTRATRRRPETDLHRTDLTTEAIRLARGVHRAAPDDGEVAGLLALDAAHRRAPESNAPARTARSSRSPSRTGRVGPHARSPRASRSSATRSRTRRSVRTSSRRRSPRCTTRHRSPRPPTGRRSSRSTSCSIASHPTRWSR